MSRSDNATNPIPTDEEFAAWREQAAYDKPWQGAMDQAELEKVRAKAGPTEEEKRIAVMKEKVSHTFDRYDRDGNEVLDIREIKSILIGCGMPRDNAEKLFKAMDKNNDKQISKKEFFTFIFGAKESGSAVDAADEVAAFATRPIKPDEALEEFMSFLKTAKDDPKFAEKVEKILGKRGLELENGEGSTLDMRDIFKFLDTNNNGKISFSEFGNGLRSMGYAMDEKLAKKMFQLMDIAHKNKKGLVDMQGKPIYLRDGVLDMDDMTKAWMEG
eukprot:gb/GFBE01036761.1/.p1 GENE.gb/GFBE01036761.1/~~gb/GFBE01036761.1/.p1  ORF type:complete len:272 (+),score=103.02 gb/GFBE01036761.1/:1-816(+)